MEDGEIICGVQSVRPVCNAVSMVTGGCARRAAGCTCSFIKYFLFLLLLWISSSARANCQFDLLCSEEIVILVSKRTLAIGLGKCSAALPVTAAQFLLDIGLIFCYNKTLILSYNFNSLSCRQVLT